jgi:hypothetical protein
MTNKGQWRKLQEPTREAQRIHKCIWKLPADLKITTPVSGWLAGWPLFDAKKAWCSQIKKVWHAPLMQMAENSCEGMCTMTMKTLWMWYLMHLPSIVYKNSNHTPLDNGSIYFTSSWHLYVTKQTPSRRSNVQSQLCPIVSEKHSPIKYRNILEFGLLHLDTNTFGGKCPKHTCLFILILPIIVLKTDQLPITETQRKKSKHTTSASPLSKSRGKLLGWSQFVAVCGASPHQMVLFAPLDKTKDKNQAKMTRLL